MNKGFTTNPNWKLRIGELEFYIVSWYQGVVALIERLGPQNLAVISSCSHAVRRFERLARAKGIPAKHSSIIQKDNPVILEAVLEFLRTEAVSPASELLMLTLLI